MEALWPFRIVSCSSLCGGHFFGKTHCGLLWPLRGNNGFGGSADYMVQCLWGAVLGRKFYTSQWSAGSQRRSVYYDDLHFLYVGVQDRLQLSLCQRLGLRRARRMAWNVCRLDLPDVCVYYPFAPGQMDGKTVYMKSSGLHTGAGRHPSAVLLLSHIGL